MKSGVPNLRALRKRHRFTQQALGDASGIPQATISELESGQQQRVDFETLQRLARAMKVDVSRLFDPPAKTEERATAKSAPKAKTGRK